MQTEPEIAELQHPVYQLTTTELNRYRRELELRCRGSLPMPQCKLSYAADLTWC
jgi:hypothetical protein